jgi:transposase
MQQRTFEPWTTSHLSKCIKRLGYVRVIAHKRSREASPAAQYAYKLLIQGYGIEQEHMVFADEVSTDSRCGNRSRAWVKKGDISKLGATFVRGRRYSTIAAMSTHGLMTARTVEGSATGDIFMSFLIDQVLPELNQFPEPNSVLILDNCSIHRKADIKAVVRSCGALVFFLPPYSPLFNPIESLFSKYKQYFKTYRDTLTQVPAVESIWRALSSISPQDCQRWVDMVPFYTKGA